MTTKDLYEQDYPAWLEETATASAANPTATKEVVKSSSEVNIYSCLSFNFPLS